MFSWIFVDFIYKSYFGSHISGLLSQVVGGLPRRVASQYLQVFNTRIFFSFLFKANIFGQQSFHVSRYFKHLLNIQYTKCVFSLNNIQNNTFMKRNNLIATSSMSPVELTHSNQDIQTLI